MHRGMSPGLLALTLIIPLSGAMSNTFIKWRLPHVPAAPLTTMILILVVAGLALVPLQLSPRVMAAWHIGPPTEAVVTPEAVVFLLLLGVVGSGVSTMVFIWLVLQRGPLFGSRRAGEVLEPAAAGDIVTSLPLSAEAEGLVALPEIAMDDRLPSRPESQVA
jgi:hypothetical protein